MFGAMGNRRFINGPYRMARAAAHRPSPPSALLRSLSEVIQKVSALHELPPADAANFATTVQRYFLETDYEALQRLTRGPGYDQHLAVIVTRLLFDWWHRPAADESSIEMAVFRPMTVKGWWRRVWRRQTRSSK